MHPPNNQLVVRENRPQAERGKSPMLSLTGQMLEKADFEHFKYLFG
jgi:hypothetical protein